MPFGVVLEKSILDWALRTGATATQPGGCFVGVATQAPTSMSAFEWSDASYARATATFGGADPGAGSAANLNSVDFNFANSAVVVGLQIWDSASAGTMLAAGTVGRVLTGQIDTIVSFAAGALVVQFA
jgi:hypothetical protein